MAHVLVIGGGITGLTSAWTLLDRGYQVTVIAKQYASPEHKITSQIAGALWEYPPAVCGNHTHKSTNSDISKKWCLISFRRFQEMAADPVLSQASGVRMRTCNFFFCAPVLSCPLEATKMAEIQANVPGFRHDAKIIEELGVNTDYGVIDAYSHLAPVIDTDQYMTWLMNYLKTRKGINFLTDKITGDLLAQEFQLLKLYGADIILNATGFGAKELANDPDVYAVRGALVRIISDGTRFPRITQAMCVSIGDFGENDFVFIIPRNDDTVVVGGTSERHETDLDINLNNYEPMKQMFEKNLKFYPHLKNAEIDPDYPIAVGVRPFRQTDVRVEREKRLMTDGTSSRIVHSYAQGGSGFTLSFGCAEEAADIVDGIMLSINNKKETNNNE